MTALTGPARRGAVSRQAILQAATDVFARRGFRGGVLAEVADVVQMTPAGILYHFGSKEALLLAVIQYRDERAGALVAEVSAATGLDALTGLVVFAEMAESEPGLAALHTVLQIENLEAGDPAYDYFQTRTRGVQAWIRRLLEAAEVAGEIRPGVDLDAKALEIVAWLEGAVVLWLLNRELSIVELYRNYLASVVAQLRTPTPGRRSR